jgi:hypothetical protein
MTILIGFTIYIMYLLISSKFEQPTFQVTTCATGACITDFLTGVKTCPTNDSDTLIYDPTQSACNSKFLCDNPITPYAVQSDGSTNNSGICEPGVPCKCVTMEQCPSYVVSIFTASNGNPYTEFQGQRLSFPQSSSYTPTNGNPISQPPLQLTNPTSSFCTVSINWLILSSPGCNFTNALNPSYSDIVTCMGMSSGCSSPIGNPCLQGTLAFIGTAQNINASNFSNNLLGCVVGESCPCGQVAIYDTGYGGIICKSL